MNWRIRVIGSTATDVLLLRACGFSQLASGVRLRVLPSYYAVPRVPKSRRTFALGPSICV